LLNQTGNRLLPNRRSKKLRHLSSNQPSLNYESLEHRALMAGFNWSSFLSNPLVSQFVSQFTSQLSSTPIYAQNPSVVGSSTVTAKTAKLTALGSDDGGESSLKYFWQAQSAPTGGTLQFSANGSNAAKNTTVTFSRAGTYQILSRVVDRLGLFTTSVVTVQVNQTATTVGVRNAANRAVNPGSTVATPGSSLNFTSQVLDQFGIPMSVQPSVVWSIPTKPTGSAPNTTPTGNSVALGFDQAGDYVVRAVSGTLSTQFTARVAQTQSRLGFSQVSGASLTTGQTLSLAGRELTVRLQGFDQFDDPVAKLTNPSWSVVTKPLNGNATITNGNGSVNFSFTRAGNYTLRCQTPAGPFNLNIAVSQVFTSVSAAAGSVSLNQTKSTQLSANTANFAVTGLDQFGQTLATQPTFSWSLPTRPVNSSATVGSTGSSMQLQFDRIGAYVVRVSSGSVAGQFPLEIIPKLNSLVVTTLGSQAVSSGASTTVTSDGHQFNIVGLDQFGQQLAKLPALTWTTLSAPTGGTASASIASNVASFKFTRAGNYLVRVSSGAELFQFSFAVQSKLSRLEILSSAGAPIKTGTTITSRGTPATFSARGLDQFNQAVSTQPSITWSAPTKPDSASPTLNQTGNQLAISFERAGSYGLVASTGSLHSAIFVNIAQRLTRIQLTPGSVSLETGATQQFSASLLDQFERAMSTQTAPAWTATGGTISSSGLYTAGSNPGTFLVTARSGTLTKTASVTLSLPAIVDGFSNSDIRTLVVAAYSDNTISRTEMIEILRSAGDGGTVTATELADLRFLIADSSNYQMPDHVRNLAGDVVTGNDANATYQGQSLGNLAAGSTDTRLNRLVDKWFLGTDLPILTDGSLQYRAASGNLFVGTPGLGDAKQGMLGDCYFIASLASIAARNPTAVQNMFIDNGDNTFTVRFFGGSYGAFYDSSGQVSTGFASGKGYADYVTINRQLPTYSTGSYAYSNYGFSSTSTNVPLWIALAEKAYAQWNQTGNAGRDRTNRYASIEGGWMGDVNAQVLGYNSTMNYFSSSSSSALVNALSSGRAVTLGTRSSTGIGDLVGGHAYTVSGYNSSTGRFTLHNPWGFSHPAPLTWSQLVSSCSAFVVVNPTSSGVASAPVWNFSFGIQNRLTAEIESAQLSATAQTGSPVDSSERNITENRQTDPERVAELTESQQPNTGAADSVASACEWEQASNSADSQNDSDSDCMTRDFFFEAFSTLTDPLANLTM